MLKHPLTAILAAGVMLAVPLGSVFPDERIVGPHGEVKHLSDLWREKPVVLVLLDSCQAKLPTIPDPRIKVVGIVERRCAGPAMFFDPEGGVRKRLEQASSAVLLDTDGSVRRVFHTAVPIPDDVRQWFDGKAVYRAQCARCHGDDGADTSYPNIRVLSGIGNRHSQEEILDMTQRAGFVDLHALDDRARRALAIYVAGL